MNKIKTILISQVPLPYHKIGSWTTLYDNYIKHSENIDVIVCPSPKKKYTKVDYVFFKDKENLIDKIKRKLKVQTKWTSAITSLEKVINHNDKFVIQIVDNTGLCFAVNNFLEKNNLKRNCYIQFFYHGYSPFMNENIYSYVDELVLLTQSSYEEMKRKSNVFPCKISILKNGIDTNKFFKINEKEKLVLKESLGVKNKIVFTWCSQDRPKKGLHIILEVWKEVFKKYKNVELWIIGANWERNIEGVRFFGRIPNKDLPKYYQATDCYLFPTLCQEGFGLSLIEALHSGCYCIASGLGGVPEVLELGKYGKLIENPNFPIEWEKAIVEFIENKNTVLNFDENLYTFEKWEEKMNLLIEKAKQTLHD